MSNPDSKHPGPSSRLSKWIAAYRGAAIILLNTVMLFLLVNLLLLMVFVIRDLRRGPALGPAAKYSEEKLASVYPGLARDALEALLKETWSRPYGYDDYVMFREQPFAGKYVNVAEAGFRHVAGQGPWPPRSESLNVFVFGGSTTFGYGVADGQTVPSFLQQALSKRLGRNVCVYNFGAGYYYSTQERILFEKLLSNGFKPDVAVFIDGLNEAERLDDRPHQSDAFKQVVVEGEQRVSLGRWGRRIPLMRAVRYVARPNAEHGASLSVDWMAPTNKVRLSQAVRRYRRNIEMLQAVCSQAGIDPVFVWQPVPGFDYDTKRHLFPDMVMCIREAALYAEMEADLVRLPASSRFLWCADLQRNAQECLYVDSVHYTANFAQQFAEAIVARCEVQGILRPWMGK